MTDDLKDLDYKKKDSCKDRDRQNGIDDDCDERSCPHNLVEAENYGQERDNVECLMCGRLWIRSDRVVVSQERLDGDIVLSLAGIADQCRKLHYWNAIFRTHKLLERLFVLFNDVLKGRRVGEISDDDIRKRMQSPFVTGLTTRRKL